MMMVAFTASTVAQSPTEEPAVKTRKIFVPYQDLKVILDSGPQRVLLSREQYEDLVKKAKKTPEKHVPHPAVVVSSDYHMTGEEGRARIRGELAIDVLDDGMHLVPLDLGGVGLLSAALDDRPAAIGRAADGQLNLLVSGPGRHRLTLELVAPLEITSAQQVLRFRLTNAAVGMWHLTVPGDVEIKGGADVVTRELDAKTNVTRFALLPRDGDTTLRMSLNSHLQRREQVVAARCVAFDEVTEAYERLHATMTFYVLHRAVDRFSFVVPDGFDITQIDSPLMARWDIATEGGKRIANVRLREQTSDTVALSVSAIKTPNQLRKWRFPQLEVRNVVSQVTVLGLVVQSDLKTESLAAENLIALDTAALAGALPASLTRQEADAVPCTFVAAYYAPQAARLPSTSGRGAGGEGGYELSADFTRPPATLAVTTHLLLNIQDKGCDVQGGFLLVPTTEKRFDFDLLVPQGWNVTVVTGPNNVPLTIERFSPRAGEGTLPGHIRVKLPQGIVPGQAYPVEFTATYTPAGWMRDWKRQSLDFPMFRIAGAAGDEGALAVAAGDDLEVRPEKLDRLVPIVDEDKARFGLANSATALAYRYETRGAKAALTIERTEPRITVRTFSFFRVLPEGLAVHYELIYTIGDARTRKLALLLPVDTPDALEIKGLGDVSVKERVSEPAGGMRRWNILLGDARRGEVRLAVDFQLPPEALAEVPPPDPQNFSFPAKQKIEPPQPDATGKTSVAHDFALPLVKADGVAYQSGVVAVEGGADMDVQVKTNARRADVGQLAAADYPLGRHLLAAYSFAGDLPSVTIDIVRNPSYALTPAIVQRATLKTLLSADGNSQTQADFQLRASSLYLEVELPQDATLWSAVLDNVPLKPQKKDGARLLGLPPSGSATRNLQLVYEAPIADLPHGGQLRLRAPKLRCRVGNAKEAAQIPLVNMQWKVTVPAGYEVVSTDGTLEPTEIERPAPAPLVVANTLFTLGGGFSGGFFLGGRAATKNAGRQWGFAVQDNMVTHYYDLAPAKSEAPAAAQTESSPGGDRGGREDGKKKAETYMGLAGSLSESQLHVHDALPDADANMAIAPGLSTPKAPATPPSSTTTVSGAIHGPARRIPSAEAKPEGAKPGESANDAHGAASSSGALKGKISGGIAGKPAYRGRFLGVSSLKIDIQQAGESAARTGEAADEQIVTFNSLGASPEIVIALADRSRLTAMSWAAGLIAFLLGVAATRRSVWQKVAFVLLLGFAAAIVPLAWDTVSVVVLCNAVFYAASLLVPYYLAAGVVRWIMGRVLRVSDPLLGRTASAAPYVVALLIALSLSCAASESAAQPPVPAAPLPAASAPDAVPVPEDALIVPYDTKAKNGVQKADHLLVPYGRYVELWNRAHPDERIDLHPAPLPYAISAASYHAMLEGEETLNLVGQMQINVLAEGYVSVPLALRGGVLARATLDGKPAQIKIIDRAPYPLGERKAVASQTSVPSAPIAKGRGDENATLFLLQLTGKGPHKLEMEIRLRLARMGGWRGTAGALPVAPATTVALHVPQPQTEVRIGQTVDRRNRETTQPNETIETALAADGSLQVQWRPKVAEAQVDRGLTVQSNGLLDIEEDGLRVALNLKLDFPRGQRDGFTLTLPAEYLVEKVAGGNVRGWEVRRAATEQSVEVNLLKTAKESERISLFLARSGRVGLAPLDRFTVPCVGVRDAALNSGQFTVRRSVLLDVRTIERKGVSRVDLGPLPDLSGSPATAENVLAVRPYEAYHFAAMPFVLRLSAAPTVGEATAEAQTRVVLSTDQPRLESKILYRVGQRKLYRLEIALPDDLHLDEVALPAAGQWTIEKRGKQSVLCVTLSQGIEGDATLILRGKLAAGAEAGATSVRELPLPRLDVLGVKRQEGEIAVQADPAFNVEVRDLRDCQETELDRVNAWLDAPFRAATRVALRYAGGTPSGRLRLVPRKPEVVCDTITNVKVTDRAIEETIVVNYEIANAGIREVTFLLPASMRDARISSPMLRRKTNEPLDPKAVDSPRRIRLELQGDAMNDLRVLVENDRLLPQGQYVAPLPTFAAADAELLRHQYVVLESTNRDELRIDASQGMEALNRQQQQWRTLCGLLHTDNLYKAFSAQPGAAERRLSFHLQRQEDLETAGARIDLAQTTMVVDANGAYRAQVEFTLDNSSEQFLDVELPRGATLWTVLVAGAPVKPARVPGGTSDRNLLVPVAKTAKGDLSYPVVLKYGGTLPPLSAFVAVRFPLVRNVKSYPKGAAIGIDRSQLNVYVPRSHEWYFYGTLHPTDEQQQKAAQVAVFNKLGERLLEAANDSDPYTRLRAGNSLMNWSAQAAAVQADVGRAGNGALQSEVAANTTLIAKAKDLVSKSQEARQLGDESTDNRRRLNDLYQKQIVKNGSGTLVLSGANTYAGATTVANGTLVVGNNNAYSGGKRAVKSGGALPAQNGEFNPNWIDRNNLNCGQLNENLTGGRIVLNDQPQLRGNVISGNANMAFTNGDVLAIQGQGGGQAGQQNAAQRPQGAAFSNAIAQAADRSGGNVDQQQREIAQYQQKLSVANGATLSSNYGIGRTTATILGTEGQVQLRAGGPVDAEGRAGAKHEESKPADSADKKSGAWVATAAGAAPAGGALPVAPTGLASLDFELPTDNDLCQVYRFTTPRGEADLTARTVRASAVAKLVSLAGIAAIGVVCWILIRLIRNGALSWFQRPLGAAVLLLAGGVLLCSGALPLLALAAIVAAIGLLIAALVARKAARTLGAPSS